MLHDLIHCFLKQYRRIIRRPLRGHQAERANESLLCKRSFKVKSTVQEKLKLMAWSFLRGLEASSFEVLLERCKMSAF